MWRRSGRSQNPISGANFWAPAMGPVSQARFAGKTKYRSRQGSSWPETIEITFFMTDKFYKEDAVTS